MPPPNISPIIPKPDELEEAASAAKKAALVFAAVVAAIKIAPKYPKSTAAITHFLTGFEVTPGKGIKVKPLAIAWLAPQPFGIVPPKMWGLPPEFSSLRMWKQAIFEKGGRTKNQNEVADRIRREQDQTARQIIASAKGAGDAMLLDAYITSQTLPLFDERIPERSLMNAQAVLDELREEIIRRGGLTISPVKVLPANAFPELLVITTPAQNVIGFVPGVAVVPQIAAAPAPAKEGGAAGIVAPPQEVIDALTIGNQIASIGAFFSANPPDP